MTVRKIETSKYNHGEQSAIIATVTVEHEIKLTPDHILKLLRNVASDDMAKIFNWMGAEWNKWEIDEAHMCKELDTEGIKLVDNLFYFLHSGK